MSLVSAPDYSRRSLAAIDLSAPRLVAFALICGLAVGTYFGLTSGQGSQTLFKARFGQSGLVTNEWAYYNPGTPGGASSKQWEATSGSLFALDGNGWTGVPDGRAPGPTSAEFTDSAVFRLRTRRADFANVAIAFRLRLIGLVTTPRTPAAAYDGVHVWLRYQSPQWLYFASVSRRDGNVVIGKKLPTADGGVYTDLVRAPGHRFPPGRWESVRVTIRSVGTAVLITVFIENRVVAHAVDTGRLSPAIRRPGRVGLRGDNANFEFRDLTVSRL